MKNGAATNGEAPPARPDRDAYLTAGAPADLIDATQAARLVKTHVSTIYRWIYFGKLEGWRVGSRYRVSEEKVRMMVCKVVPEPPSPPWYPRGA